MALMCSLRWQLIITVLIGSTLCYLASSLLFLLFRYFPDQYLKVGLAKCLPAVCFPPQKRPKWCHIRNPALITSSWSQSHCPHARPVATVTHESHNQLLTGSLDLGSGASVLPISSSGACLPSAGASLPGRSLCASRWRWILKRPKKLRISANWSTSLFDLHLLTRLAQSLWSVSHPWSE